MCRIPVGRALIQEQNVTEILIYLAENGAAAETCADAGLLLEAVALAEAEANEC
jgi:hypothetical protein